jgi:cyclic pyranopterin phosphate synthase
MLTHADRQGRVRMVDVSAKPVTARVAVARGFVRVSIAARRLIQAGAIRSRRRASRVSWRPRAPRR